MLTLSPLPACFDPNALKTYLHTLEQTIDHTLTTLGNDGTHHIERLVELRCQATDAVLRVFFEEFLSADLALFATGGYGRGELFPKSDVDLLILGEDVAQHTQRIESFVANLWDLGIHPAILVHKTADLHSAVCDQSVATALLEARIVAGNTDLATMPLMATKNAWTTQEFFCTKIHEAQERHKTHNATEYNLEPNLKNAPGGLRDLHIISWLGKFYFTDTKTADDLVEVGFLHAQELDTLNHAKRFLWCLRHHLHTHSKRMDDRLLFDHQKAVAKRMGYLRTDDSEQITCALESMMRTYYRHAVAISSLSELLCQYFGEMYLDSTESCTALTEDFYRTDDGNNAKIAAYDDEIFVKKPCTILRMFLFMGRYDLKKIAAKTLRSLRLASPSIDECYRQNPTHKALFLANLQENNYLYHRLRLMSRYGALGRYLPEFGQILGLMQYDLFHRYTVDAHTLLLIRILHRFDTDTVGKFDLVGQVYQQIHRKDILVIAALFHDIAKGRGGDHSELGAICVRQFCLGHGMSDADAQFVSWLVSEHLTMSLTAQKKDVFDPEVIGAFAKFTGTIAHLNHLYVLTVADMNATNSELWNSWRASLLKQLYISTYRVLSLGSDTAKNTQMIALRKAHAKELAMSSGADLDALWQGFKEDYFLKQKASDIAWQSDTLLSHTANLVMDAPIIALRPHADLVLDAVQLFVATKDRRNLFALSVCTLDNMGLSVLDANIITATVNGTNMALDTYVLIDRFAKRDEFGSLVSGFLGDKDRKHTLIHSLCHALSTGACSVRQTLANHKLRHFAVPTSVHFEPATSSAHQGQHQLSLVTKDRPALLAQIGALFTTLEIEVHGARITTLGERAEDVFYISGSYGQALSDEKLKTLQVSLIALLD